MHLVDYKVRVINSEAATAAGVRVVIESRDEDDVWGTVGVSENIIEASWIALVDSFEYKLCKDEEKRAKGAPSRSPGRTTPRDGPSDRARSRDLQSGLKPQPDPLPRRLSAELDPTHVHHTRPNLPKQYDHAAAQRRYTASGRKQATSTASRTPAASRTRSSFRRRT